jgi:Ca2+:H+ antiporter
MFLDSIKKQAHRHAWGDDGTNYNPFRRYRSRSSTADIEEGPTHSQTFPPESPSKRNSRPVPHAKFRSEPVTTTEKDFEQASPKTAVGENRIAEEAPSDQTLLSSDGDGPKNRQPASVDRSPTDETTEDSEEAKKRRRHEVLKRHIPFGEQLRATLFPHWYTINWLILASPVGIGLHFAKGINPLAVFVVNFIAIVPLAGILSFATEEIALRVGETLGGLLNATFG